MHELSLAQTICETVARNVTADQRVVAVVVEWGPLSGVVPESLTYCFGIVAPAMGLAAAELRLRTVPARAVCPACDARFEVEQMWAQCPACDHAPVTITGGTDFRLKEIEVEEAADSGSPGGQEPT